MIRALAVLGAFALGLWTADGALAIYRGATGQPWPVQAPILYHMGCGIGGQVSCPGGVSLPPR